MSNSSESKFISIIKLLPILGASIAFMWGVIQFSIEYSAQIEVKRIEATRAFLEKQLSLYTEITRITSRIATRLSKDTDRQNKDIMADIARFRELYFGELVLVENEEVSQEMQHFNMVLDYTLGVIPKANLLNYAYREKLIDSPTSAWTGRLTLTRSSLRLAHACRDSLAVSWGVKEWKSYWRKPSPKH